MPADLKKIVGLSIIMLHLIGLYFSSQQLNSFKENVLSSSSAEEPSSSSPSIISLSSQSWWKGQSRISQNQSHPHMGARHPNGSLHMIIDPSTKRLHSNGLSTKSKVTCPSGGNLKIEGEGGNQVLQRVKIGIQKYINGTANITRTTTTTTTTRKKSRIMCMVYTVHLPNNNHANLRSIAETWAQRCDGFYAASNYTDHNIGAIDLPHAGPEEYANMWQKIRSMWAYAYDHFLDEYDFFHIGGDDMYVVVDNLRAYVDGPEVKRLEDGYIDTISSFYKYKEQAMKWVTGTAATEPRPLILGSPMGQLVRCPFPAGGPGYTLNQAALKLYGKVGLETFLAENRDPREDLFMGSFFCEQGVFLSDTRDQQNGIGPKYTGSAENRYNYREGSPGPDQPKALKRRFGIEFGDGLNAVSEQTIAFHLKDDKGFLVENKHTIAELMHRYHAILYDLCPEND